MTYREKLKIEHPEYVGDEFIGGCKGCPVDYLWENATKECKDHPGQPYPAVCTKCWDREIPESKVIGYIQTKSGSKKSMINQTIYEDSTDYLIMHFKLQDGLDVMFKKNRPSGEAHFYTYSTLFKRWLETSNFTRAVVKENGMSFVYELHTPVAKDTESLYPKTTLTPCEIEYMKRDLQLTKDALAAVKKNYVAEKKRNKLPQIKNVIFNNPATIVFWDDGSKTVVKANGEDAFTPEVGLAMAISKKALGNGSSYFDEFKKWCKDEPKVENKKNELLIYRDSVIKCYVDIANEYLNKILGKTRTTPLEKEVIEQIETAQVYLGAILGYFKNEPTLEPDTIIHSKLKDARTALEKVAIYAKNPLKKDMEKAIDEALDALMDISEMYPKEG